MTPEDVKSLVDIRMSQADECLEDARTLFAYEKGWRTIVNRSYYAAFYSVLALLQTLGKIPRKHRGVIVLFDVEFVKTGLLPKELSEALHWLFASRNKEDYISLEPVSREESEQALKTSEKFVQAIRTHLHQEGFLEE
ncbi:MAG: HEPN domain-containing protein [Candidatus Omnitrophota bacterium]